MNIVVYNLGCKVNQYECDSLVLRLREQGHTVSEDLQPADVYILNTCAVTNEAERKSRQCVERCRKLNPDAQVFVMGCASQNNPTQFADKPGVVHVSGVAHKMQTAQLSCDGTVVDELPKQYEDEYFAAHARTRAYVKVQDGCNNFCTYCLIPYLRGRSRSRALDAVVAECKVQASQCKEIVLTGIDLSSYGKEIGLSLAQLLEALADLPCRVRLGSLEVNVVDTRLLDATQRLQAFCPQFHLSMQSGADATLRAMNRHYTTREYAEKVALIRRYYPDAAITTDWICGFPTETEEDFCASMEFVRSIGFAQMHVFGYSPRKGTVAARLYQPLDGSILRDRCARAGQLAEELHAAYCNRFVGKSVQVLTEQQEGDYVVGYSREYLRVALPPDNPTDTLVQARVVGIDGAYVLAVRE